MQCNSMHGLYARLTDVYRCSVALSKDCMIK